MLKTTDWKWLSKKPPSWLQVSVILPEVNLFPVSLKNWIASTTSFESGSSRAQRCTEQCSTAKIGQSPCKKGPHSKITDVLLEISAAHLEISQVGSGGDWRSRRDFKRLIGAAVLGTPHENMFKVNSAWKNLRIRHPDKNTGSKYCDCGRCSSALNVLWQSTALVRWCKSQFYCYGPGYWPRGFRWGDELVSEVDFCPAYRGRQTTHHQYGRKAPWSFYHLRKGQTKSNNASQSKLTAREKAARQGRKACHRCVGH